MKRPALGVVAAVAACLACSHAEPWGLPAIASNPTGPPPLRLTYAPQSEEGPAWLPDGSAVGFSWADPARADRDRCLAFLPPDAGRIERQVCVRGLAEQDSTSAVWAHGVSAGGNLAFLAERSGRNALAPASRDLYVGKLDGSSFRRVLFFPYIAPSGQLHDGAIDLVWPDDSTLVYLATFILYIGGGRVPPDTQITTIEVVRADLRGDSIAALTVIPGTGNVSSLALDAGTGTLYVTVYGSSRVFSLDPATGQRTPVYDFAPLGDARDVQVALGRVVAVVGGTAGFGVGAGGRIFAALLPGGAPALLADTAGGRVYRSLAIDPAGRRVVAEALSSVGKATDLWLFDLP